jgi:hypothetical protein
VRVSQITITDVVIKAIEQIAKDQGLKSLKFKNRKGAIFHDADWIAGEDFDENIQQDADNNKAYDDDENKDQEEDEDINDEYDRIDKDKPNQHQDDEGQDKDKAKEEEQGSDDDGNAVICEQETDLQGSELRRSARESQPVSRLEPSMSGKLYLQNDKRTKN